MGLWALCSLLDVPPRGCPGLQGQGSVRARGSNTAGVPTPRHMCLKWEAGHRGEALAQQDCSIHACPLPGFILGGEPSLLGN